MEKKNSDLGQVNDPIESVLLEAQAIVGGARQADYGRPFDNHSITAAYWSVLFKIDVSAKQVTLANILQKIAREQNHYKRDNFVDIAGYAENGNICAIEQMRHDDQFELFPAGVK